MRRFKLREKLSGISVGSEASGLGDPGRIQVTIRSPVTPDKGIQVTVGSVETDDSDPEILELSDVPGSCLYILNLDPEYNNTMRADFYYDYVRKKNNT